MPLRIGQAERGCSFDARSANRDLSRLLRAKELSHKWQVVVAVRQAAAEFGDGGVVVGQLLPDRQCLAVLGLRFRWLARIRQQDAEVVVAVRQAGCGIR